MPTGSGSGGTAAARVSAATAAGTGTAVDTAPAAGRPSHCRTLHAGPQEVSPAIATRRISLDVDMHTWSPGSASSDEHTRAVLVGPAVQLQGAGHGCASTEARLGVRMAVLVCQRIRATCG